MQRMPAGVATVSESGIRTVADIHRLIASGVDAVHIGETLMVAPDPGTALAELVSAARSVVIA